jgi:cobyrinic acid a,c-diamide synthase
VSQASLDGWSERLAHHTDLARVLALAGSAPALPAPAPAPAPAGQGKRCRIGVARDDAFFFYYPYNLRLLERCGAELVPFSPIADARLPEIDGLYLGGGYPELHAQALQDNVAMRRAVRDFATRGRPIYAECGGLMYLSEAIVQRDGQRREMVGVLSGVAVMQSKLAALGYVEVRTTAPTLLGEAGLVFRGHQFRYSRFETQRPPTQYRLHARSSPEPAFEGYGEDNILASYVHAHWASNPRAAEGFVSACAGPAAS